MLSKHISKYLLSIIIILNSLNGFAEDYQEGNTRFFDNIEESIILNSNSELNNLSENTSANPIKDNMNLTLEKIISENRITDESKIF